MPGRIRRPLPSEPGPHPFHQGFQFVFLSGFDTESRHFVGHLYRRMRSAHLASSFSSCHLSVKWASHNLPSFSSSQIGNFLPRSRRLKEGNLAAIRANTANFARRRVSRWEGELEKREGWLKSVLKVLGVSNKPISFPRRNLAKFSHMNNLDRIRTLLAKLPMNWRKLS